MPKDDKQEKDAVLDALEAIQEPKPEPVKTEKPKATGQTVQFHHMPFDSLNTDKKLYGFIGERVNGFWKRKEFGFVDAKHKNNLTAVPIADFERRKNKRGK